MTKRTRYFLTGSSVVVLLGLGTGLVAYYKGDLSAFKAVRVGPSELTYVSADATGLAYANVRDIMNSDFHKKIQAMLPTGDGKNQFLSETGIDIERDIESVVATSAGPGDPSDHGLVLIRGTFDQGRIESLLRQHDGAIEDYKGKRLIVSHGPGAQPSTSASKTMCLTFPEAGLAMIGSEETVKAAIDTHASHHDVTGNAAMMNLVGQMHNGSNTAWAVGGLDALTSNPNVPAQLKQQLPGVQWVAVSARVDESVSGDLRAQAKDEKSATDLRSVVTGAIAAGHLMGGHDPKLDAFLNSLQVSGSGKDLDLSFTLPAYMIDMIPMALKRADYAH